MLQAVPPRTAVDDAVAQAARTFNSVAHQACRANALMRAPIYGGPLPPEKQHTARVEARSLIRELLPVADLPPYEAALRVLHEVRRELGVQSRDVDLVALRRNLDLFLDGEPGRATRTAL